MVNRSQKCTYMFVTGISIGISYNTCRVCISRYITYIPMPMPMQKNICICTYVHVFLHLVVYLAHLIKYLDVSLINYLLVLHNTQPLGTNDACPRINWRGWSHEPRRGWPESLPTGP